MQSFHSQKNVAVREDILGSFARGYCRALVTAKILDEGVDIPDVDLGIIVSNSGSRIQLIQRMGWILRKKSDGRSARIALLYVADTPEDPAGGVHEEALEDIEAAADEIAWFSYETGLAEIKDFISPDQG